TVAVAGHRPRPDRRTLPRRHRCVVRSPPMNRLLSRLTTRTEVVAKPGVGEVHVTYRRWSGRITDVVVRPEGYEPLQLGRLSSATVQYLALSRTAQALHRRARQVQSDRQLIEALAEFAGGTS